MHLSHRIRLDPDAEQRMYFARAAGTARFAYNWALAEWNRRYEAGERVNEAELRKALNAIKRDEYPWMLDVTKCAPQLAIKKLGVAFGNFFAGRAAHPTFHKKGRSDSFELSNDQFALDGKRIRVPNLGWVRMRERLRLDGKLVCSVCGHVLDRLPLSMREWECPTCGTTHDRDVNAATNLKNMAVSSTVAACGAAR